MNQVQSSKSYEKNKTMQQISDDVELGKDVKIYDFVNLYGCKIGDYTKIGTFVEIQKGAVIGKKCKISSHSFICERATIEAEVFIGHNVTFTNDLYPRATNDSEELRTNDYWKCIPTIGEKISVGWLWHYHSLWNYDRRKSHDRCRKCSDRGCT